MTTTTADKGELLPCPFCGGAPYMTSDGRPHSIWTVGCSNCGIQFENYSLEGAKKEWNRRPTNEGQDGLTDEEILFEADNYALIYGGNRPELIGFAKAIERALNQRLAVKEGEDRKDYEQNCIRSCNPPKDDQQAKDAELRQVVGTVLEGFTLPHHVRKILEAAYWNDAVLSTTKQARHEVEIKPKLEAAPSVPVAEKEKEKDAERLVWAMSHMNMHNHIIGFTSHVLTRGGTGDYGDCVTYIDPQLSNAPENGAGERP